MRRWSFFLFLFSFFFQFSILWWDVIFYSVFGTMVRWLFIIISSFKLSWNFVNDLKVKCNLRKRHESRHVSQEITMKRSLIDFEIYVFSIFYFWIRYDVSINVGWNVNFLKWEAQFIHKTYLWAMDPLITETYD